MAKEGGRRRFQTEGNRSEVETNTSPSQGSTPVQTPGTARLPPARNRKSARSDTCNQDAHVGRQSRGWPFGVVFGGLTRENKRRSRWRVVRVQRLCLRSFPRQCCAEKWGRYARAVRVAACDRVSMFALERLQRKTVLEWMRNGNDLQNAY